MWDSFKNRIRNAIDVLENPIELPVFRANIKVATEDFQGSRPITIESTAAKTIQRWYSKLRIGRAEVAQPFRSRYYSLLKRSIGLPHTYWNLILTGRLAKSMKYFVKDGALHVSYDDARKVVVRGLKGHSGIEDLLHPSAEEAKEMSSGAMKSVLQRFLRVWQRKE